jgi:small-conductance mechanosensitive channel
VLAAPGPAAFGQASPAATEGSAQARGHRLALVSGEAEATRARLAALEAALRSTSVPARIGDTLDARALEVAALGRRLDRELAGFSTRDELNALRETSRELDHALAEELEEVSRWIERLDAELSRVSAEAEVWELTRAAAQAGAAPESVLAEIAAVQAELARVRAELELRQREALDLSTRVANERGAIEAMRARVDLAWRELLENLFSAQEEPLWRLRIDAPLLRAQARALGRSLADMGLLVLRYASRHRDRVVLHLLGIGLLLWLVHRARAALAAEPPAAAPPGRPQDALAHPTAAALLLGLGLGPLFYLPLDPPLPMRMLGALLFLPAALRVLRGMLPAALRGPTTLLFAAAALDVLRTSFAEFALVARLLLLPELALALVAVWWIRRPEHLQLLQPFFARRETPRLARLWLDLALLALAAGLAATPLGLANLADASVVAVRGSYLALIIVAAARVAGAVGSGLVERGDLDGLHMVRNNHAVCVRALRSLLGIAGIFVWLYGLLWTLQLRGPLFAAVAGVLSTSFGYGPVEISLGSVLAFALTLWLSWLLARVLGFVLDQEVFARTSLPPGVPLALSTFSRYAIFVLGFVVAMAMVGFPLDRVTLVLSALGVGIGFGLQTVASNFVSGLVLLFERPIRVGDLVQLDALVGTVTRVGMRASRMHTLDGADVIVPNSDLVSLRVVNWTLADRKRRVALPVGVAYGTPPRRVMELLRCVADSHPQVLRDPPPEVLFRGFGESSLDFELRAWTESARGWLAVQSELALATCDALAAAGIQIPFPQRDVHVRSVAPAALAGPAPAPAAQLPPAPAGAAVRSSETSIDL